MRYLGIFLILILIGCSRNSDGLEFAKNYTIKTKQKWTASGFHEQTNGTTYQYEAGDGYSYSTVSGDSISGYNETRDYGDRKIYIERYPNIQRKGESANPFSGPVSKGKIQ